MATSSTSPPGVACPGQSPSAHDEGALARRTTHGPQLYFYTWVPPDKPRAAVALLHGFADYGARYAHVGRAWAERGICVWAIDMRGHGRAQGARGACRRFGEYLEDAAELVELLRQSAPDAPAFLFGHSFGALVATAQAQRSPEPWRGLILTSPNYAVAAKVAAWKKLAGQVASRLLPDFALPSGLHGAHLTHDAAIARAYDEDPLVFKKARARWFTEMNAAQRSIMAAASSLRLPLYITMGTTDPVAAYGSARAFFDTVGSTDKTFDAREGLFHEVLNEPEWPDIAGRMADWILARS